MAEALTVVGIIANIIALIEFGNKVHNRLKEYCEKVEDIPKAFHSISIELPLILDALHHLEKDYLQNVGKAPSEETLSALLPVVHGCRVQVELLKKILSKLGISDDLWWKRARKLVSSFSQEKNAEKVSTTLHNYIGILTFHHMVSYQSQQTSSPFLAVLDEPPKKDSPSIIFHLIPNQHCIPGGFVGRDRCMTELSRLLLVPDSHCRAALVGLGGIGYAFFPLSSLLVY